MNVKTLIALLVGGLALSACHDNSEGSAPASAPLRAAERSCTELLLPMSDGVRLHAWVSTYYPDDPRPILFEFETYAQHENGCPPFAPGEPDLMSQEVIDEFTIVHVSYRGTGASEGVFDLSGPRTQADIREAIAWAAAQPFSNGDVVLTGQSGTGFAAHFGLLEPSVRAAIIYTSCADQYRCFRRGGIYNGLGEVYMARTLDAWAKAAADRQRLGTDNNPPAPQQLAALTTLQAQTAENTPFTEFWAVRSSLERLPKVTIPVLYTSEVFDIVQSFDALQLTPSAHFVFGIGHSTLETVANSEGRHAELLRSVVDGFARRHGLREQNGEAPTPAVALMMATGGVRGYRAGETLVRYEDAWPLRDTRWTKLFLSPVVSGSADSLNDGSLSVHPPENATSSIVPMISALATEGDLRTTSWLTGAIIGESNTKELSGLTFTTPELATDTEITGPVMLRVFATANATDFDWVVRLTDVWPDGTSHWISDGYLRASLSEVDHNRSQKNSDGDIVRPWHSFTQRSAPALGERREYLIDIIPTANIFRASHRIRLDIFPVAASSMDRNALGVGTLEVHLGGQHASYIQLPLIPARCDLATPLIDTIEPPITACAASWTEATGGAQ